MVSDAVLLAWHVRQCGATKFDLSFYAVFVQGVVEAQVDALEALSSTMCVTDRKKVDDV